MSKKKELVTIWCDHTGHPVGEMPHDEFEDYLNKHGGFNRKAAAASKPVAEQPAAPESPAAPEAPAVTDSIEPGPVPPALNC